MWYEVQRLTSQELNKSQIHRETGLDRSTVRKYQNMEENEFHNWIKKPRNLPKKLSEYKPFVKQMLSKKSYLSAAQIEDRLKEKYNDLPKIHSKTVYNFVMGIREQYDLPKPKTTSTREFEKLPEPDFGKQAQVDFGETWMQTKEEKRKKIYFFTIQLSRSRYKFVVFDNKPFTAKTSVEAHHLAFDYFQGVPKEILYDQDSVFIHDENLGDYLLTMKFSNFCKSQDFKAIFCRKADPQSKGKIENVVKYIKQNFLRGRDFKNIDLLNQQALAWLERTGNKKKHSSTKLIPTEQWEEEKEHLLPIKMQIKNNKELKSYKVRKDNTICYKSNFYSLPLDTYKGKDSSVLLEILDEKLKIYTSENKKICTHKLSTERGQTIRNTDHNREKSKTLEMYQEQVLQLFDNTEIAKEYFEKLHKDKSRYYRDNLQYIIKNHGSYSIKNMKDALVFCLENKILNAKFLIKILDKKEEEIKKEKEVLENIKNIDDSKTIIKNEDEYKDIKTSNINKYENILS